MSKTLDHKAPNDEKANKLTGKFIKETYRGVFSGRFHMP
jgi:hypothetical protein